MPFLKRLFGRATPVLRCSFCNKSQRDVLKLVAGPGVHICNECTAICAALVADDEKAHLKDALAKHDTLDCRLCGKTKVSRELLHVPNAGPVCFTCVGAIKVAAGPDWDFRAE